MRGLEVRALGPFRGAVSRWQDMTAWRGQPGASLPAGQGRRIPSPRLRRGPGDRAAHRVPPLTPPSGNWRNCLRTAAPKGLIINLSVGHRAPTQASGQERDPGR